MHDIVTFDYLQSVDANLRRSTRKRRMPMNLEEYTDSSGTEDEDLMVRLAYVSQVIDNYMCPSGLV